MASQISPPRDDNSTPTPIVTNDHNRPISVLSTASYSPTFIPAPRSPTRSLATEVLNTQTYQRPETGTSVHTEHTFNSSYPPSIDDEGPQNTEVSRLSFVSGESEEYARTPSPLPPKIPPVQPLHTRSNTIERHISKPTAVSDSLGFSSGSRGFLKTATTRSASSPGASTTSKIESIGDIDSGSDYQRASVLISDDIVSSNHETWPLRTPTGSPTPPKKDIQGLKPLQPKSPFIVSDVATQSSSIPDPQPVISQPSVRSPKASRFNFLPKFLRSTSAKGEPPVAPAKSPKRSPNDPDDPESFFDDGVSDEDPDEDPGEEGGYGYDIQDARPAMVVRSGSNTIELKEMLRSTPPIADRPGPSRVEAGSRLRTHIDSDTEDSTKKEGIYQGLPQAEKGEDPNPQPGSAKSGHHGLGAWKDINPFAMSVLRSHQSLLRNDVSPPPPTPPKSAPAGRKVSFPTPAPLDVRPEHRFLRQSIVSTPYPTAGDDGKHRKKRSISGPAHKIEHDNQANAVLTLVLYGNSNPIPKVKTIAVPSPQETQLIEETENGKPPIIATQTLPFDDEALSKLLRSTYNTMRGPLRYLATARKVRNLRLLSYTSITQLASRHAKPTQFRSDNGEDIAEERLLDLFQKPRLGRGRNEWTSWVKALPENGKGSENLHKDNKIAIEFVEGWAPAELYGAVAAVLFCSILAMFLYIFVGMGVQVGLLSANSGSDVDLKDLRNGLLGAVESQAQESPVVYKGPGVRVQTGAELGILVLMIGWTAVGGWGLLSWLVT